MVMSILWSLSLFLSLVFQAGSPAGAPGSALTPTEQLKLEKEDKIDGRIKIYQSASKRIQRTIEEAVGKDDFKAVPQNLRLWVSLLSDSLKDIGSNLKTKKKSRALIKFEIQVRKEILATQNYKIKAPIDQQDLFESCLEQAENVRSKFVELLFGH